MMAESLDKYDVSLLDSLQKEDGVSLADLAHRVNLSSSQCSRRINRLKKLGYIKKQVAQLNPKALGLDVSAFVTVTLEKHGKHSAESFQTSILHMDQILECHSITGDGDYLLKVMALNSQALNEFIMKELLTLPGVSHVKTALALASVKSTTALPL
ncbi:Lrp/AsnC family transcriptional regulator [Endozoicomonas numazuensis]|uniref:HTH asnC-type domain-containing protein n=1 Tax=Endozoicomonas numazuensis TaxID=1137799 RepID=A0A081NCF9_9GAMM|nr:Lrp/AsnC family transcriptional regulator [Endozoicomonas numazuensis]KEQ16132.1 hypothetical protein GZ78_22990 [Endozoicomonas numazuensis]